MFVSFWIFLLTRVLCFVTGPAIGNRDAPRRVHVVERHRQEAVELFGEPRWRGYAATTTGRDEPAMASLESEKYGDKVGSSSSSSSILFLYPFYPFFNPIKVRNENDVSGWNSQVTRCSSFRDRRSILAVV